MGASSEPSSQNRERVNEVDRAVETSIERLCGRAVVAVMQTADFGTGHDVLGIKVLGVVKVSE